MGSGAAGSAVGRVVEDRVIPAGEPWARVLTRGQVLRIVDLEGKQAVDFLCYNAADPEERYNAADTMKYAKTIFLTRGHGIYSDRGRRLFTIVGDTCGRHDTIGGCCSAESNEVRYGVKRSEEHTSELQSHHDLVCRLLLEKKKKTNVKEQHKTTSS